MVQQIRKHGAKYWQAPAWLLEHTDQENFGIKTQVKVQLEAEVNQLLSMAQEVCCGECFSKLLQRITGDNIITLGAGAARTEQPPLGAGSGIGEAQLAEAE
jgi:hypothetical protein